MIIGIVLQLRIDSGMVELIQISLVRLDFQWICPTFSCVIFIKLCHHNGAHISQQSIGKRPLFYWLGAVTTQYYWDGVGAGWGKDDVYHQRNIDENARWEIINHRSLRHPNIVRFKEVLLTPTYLAILMEYVASGELFEHICQARRFSEDEVCSSLCVYTSNP